MCALSHDAVTAGVKERSWLSGDVGQNGGVGEGGGG